MVQVKTPMKNSYFGEGLARFGDKLYQITWLTNEGFIYSIPDLKQVRLQGPPFEGTQDTLSACAANSSCTGYARHNMLEGSVST